MFSIRRVVGLTSVLFVLSACGGGSSSGGDSGTQPTPPSTPTYSVTTSVIGNGSGTVTPTSSSVTQGSVVSFTISPSDDSEIISVTGCGGSLSGTTFTTQPIGSDCSITVTFEKKVYTVVTTVTGGGSIDPAFVNAQHGDALSFAITADSGFEVGSATGCNGRLEGTTYLLPGLTASCEIVVVFQPTSSSVPVLNETSRLLASDRQEVHGFGRVLDSDGITLIVGDVQARETGGFPSGAAYLFEQDAAGIWRETTRLLPSQRIESSDFGRSVAVLGDLAVVGTNQSRAVAFRRNSLGEWQEDGQLEPDSTQSEFSYAVALASGTIAVSSLTENTVYVYEDDAAGGWALSATLSPSDSISGAQFGVSLAIGHNVIVVGAQYATDASGTSSGAVYVFEKRLDGTWAEAAKILAGDSKQNSRFGASIDLDGDTLVVGASGGVDGFLGIGAAYIFEKIDATQWVETQKLMSDATEAGDWFERVAITGDTVVVGAYLGSVSGTAFVFQKNSFGEWEEAFQLLPSGNPGLIYFGLDAEIIGNTVFVGADSAEDDQGLETGAVYVFDLSQ